jgi:hypothetical protein
MVSTTYGHYRVTRVKSDPDRRPQARRGFFVRLMDSLAESRQRAALIEIGRHAHLLSPEWFELMNDSANSRARRD